MFFSPEYIFANIHKHEYVFYPPLFFIYRNVMGTLFCAFFSKVFEIWLFIQRVSSFFPLRRCRLFIKPVSVADRLSQFGWSQAFALANTAMMTHIVHSSFHTWANAFVPYMPGSCIAGPRGVKMLEIWWILPNCLPQGLPCGSFPQPCPKCVLPNVWIFVKLLNKKWISFQFWGVITKFWYNF